MTHALKSDGMTPIKTRYVWACRHCKHEWLAVNVNKPPKQCPNRKCRAADWNRPKIKSGRPRKEGRKPRRKGKRG